MKLGPRGASEAWTTHDMDCHTGGYVIHNGYNHGNDGGPAGPAFDLRTGKKQWSEHGVGKGSLCGPTACFTFSEQHGGTGPADPLADGLKITGRVKVRGRRAQSATPS